MRPTRLALTLAALSFAIPANAQSDLEAGLAGAFRGCEEWVLNPASWADGVGPFLSTVDLGDKIGLVQSVDEATLPPAELRVANHYWRINATSTAGYILVVSDRLPMCHITGGGGSDLQPVAEAVLASDGFLAHWMQVEENSRGGMISTHYRNREEPRFSLVVSRSKIAGDRQDRVQLLATAQMDLGG